MGLACTCVRGLCCMGVTRHVKVDVPAVGGMTTSLRVLCPILLCSAQHYAAGIATQGNIAIA